HGFCFQAEAGIRDFHVTGVQTCALPISSLLAVDGGASAARADLGSAESTNTTVAANRTATRRRGIEGARAADGPVARATNGRERTEERRVGRSVAQRTGCGAH